MAPLGVVLLVAGLAVCGLGIAGRIKAAQLAGLGGTSHLSKPANAIYQARRLYELPDHGQYVRRLLTSSNRLIITGVSFCLVGIVLIL